MLGLAHPCLRARCTRRRVRAFKAGLPRWPSVANTDHRTHRVRTAPSVEGERTMRVISGEIGARLRIACVAVVVVLTAAACSSPKSSASGGPKPGPNLITADEIARAN